MFACVWNVLKKSMPSEVIKDYEEIQRIYKLPVMDADGKQTKYFDLPDPNGLHHRFNLSDLAPYGGAIAQNYV
ncbi:hypothetical protein BJ508DRAFT_335824 [Ascobolus immersus RN42]|uniref:Uncharacterized protein n=1 Tax=Ascobolus immersus RN42 TaxID=1160509 RepID=A0A3N4HB19_ASCIM|nr:hypothetical protein BJ508DRAFT_335824 [Ascobolus immersus RN42]